MTMNSELSEMKTAQEHRRSWISLLAPVLLLCILLGGAYFRLAGIDWGEYQYLHPDERFLVWVGTDISPTIIESNPQATDPADRQKKVWISLSQYFDTQNSPMNPENRGHPFYVYGTLPMFLTRVIVEVVYGHSGFNEMTNIGRPLSALFDLMTVLVVYLLAKRLYNLRVGLLAAAFSAVAVMQIQESHFFTMDNFINFFTLLALYFAVRVMLGNGKNFHAAQPEPAETADTTPRSRHWSDHLREFVRHPYFWLSIGFGFALGAGVASKINAAPMALALPGAMLLHFLAMPAEERPKGDQLYPYLGKLALYLSLGAFVSLLVFRIAQPYAFSGPGFFGIKLSEKWIASLQELRNQGSATSDFPPAMQWARRPPWFALQNLVLWGMGLPLGILAWTGFLWAGWRMLKGEWRQHMLIWGWTGFYFTWQSLLFNPTMRYQLPVYPTLAIFAAWAVVRLYDQRSALQRINWRKLVAITIGAVVLVGTTAWAYAFSRIYIRPITRIEASRWIMANIPGAITLDIDTPSGTVQQPVSFPYSYRITPDQPFLTNFNANHSGSLSSIYLPYVHDTAAVAATSQLELVMSILRADNTGDSLMATNSLPIDNSADPAQTSLDHLFTLDQEVIVEAGKIYRINISLAPGQGKVDACGDLVIYVQSPTDLIDQPIIPPESCVITSEAPYQVTFMASASGKLDEVYLEHVLPEQYQPSPKTLLVSAEPTGQDSLSTTTSVTSEFLPGENGVGQGYVLHFDSPLVLEEGQNYHLTFQLQAQNGALFLQGAGIANEGEWDDGLPLRMDGYDPFGGIYPLDLNFNMYWDDNPDKLARFQRILDASDYVVITSSRQWGSLPRLPERFPMTTVYYRALLGCPDEQTIEWCYNVAQPGSFQGKLGFELIKTFESDPSIGPLKINDQFSEEAFTVYDHPKVFIFKKTQAYSSDNTHAILGSVDFTQVVRIPPGKAGSFPANLMLPIERLAEQRLGGTWSDLFNPEALQNRIEALGVIFWYVAVGLLGLFTYPLLRLALPGLSDHGYPLARTAGMLLLSYLVWLAGSFQIPFSRLTISIVGVLLLSLGVFLAYRQRDALRQEWRERRRYFLMIEVLTLAFFLFFLLVRFGNPDLWHPYKGGEKPMDFSYFNAVLKSTTFPPYDPWFAGGYLNYYYYGFVFVGVLVKWLGYVPSFAYNLILPTLFSMVAMGAFSIAWNLSASRTHRIEPDLSDELDEPDHAMKLPRSRYPFWAGLAAAFIMVVFGNLGTVRMIFRGYEMLADPQIMQENVGLITRFTAAAQGFGRSLSGTPLPYSLGDWYWVPSRVMPPDDFAITEFPYFTFLYADPHAHMFAMPLALLGLAWSVSMVLGRCRWRGLTGLLASFAIGGLAIGSLRPTNTWDFPTYMILGVVATIYAFWRFYTPPQAQVDRIRSKFAAWAADLPANSLRLLVTAGAVILLVGLVLLFFRPYTQWYGQGYTSIELWKDPRTPVDSYLTHWGLFLFLITSWLSWESIDWMANTPVSALRRLEPYVPVIASLALGLLVAVVLLLIYGVPIAWIVLPLAAWAGLLLLRPGQPDARRIALFLIGSGLVITLVVELVVLRGDIGRQNTVFKFYLQAWTLFSISSAAAFGWLLPAVRRWTNTWRNLWSIILTALLLSAALFTIMGSTAKIKDRMSTSAPHTLDGMTYMDYSTYNEMGTVMDLSQDYRAIRWMQENVQGSPVIVEADSGRLYQWFTRFTIYTGLPGVVGWEWHEQQQRALTPSSWVSQRLQEINQFYISVDPQYVEQFLRRYDVRYIIVGQLERITYAGPGLDKFEAFNGSLWNEVYRDGETVIYQVVTK